MTDNKTPAAHSTEFASGGEREAIARIVKGARLSAAFGREFRAGDGRLDDVDLDAADAILALSLPAASTRAGEGWTDYLRGIQAAKEWLRDQQHQGPPATLWHAAAVLADRMDVELLSPAANLTDQQAAAKGEGL